VVFSTRLIGLGSASIAMSAFWAHLETTGRTFQLSVPAREQGSQGPGSKVLQVPDPFGFNAHAEDVEISIAVPRYGTAGYGRYTDREVNVRQPADHFSLVIRNRSNRPLEFFTDGNSWGDQDLTFALADPDGRKWVVRHSLTAYTRNAPGVVLIEPGESWVREVFFRGAAWDGFDRVCSNPGRVFTIQAILDQRVGAWKGDPSVWVGLAKSPVIRVRF